MKWFLVTVYSLLLLIAPVVRPQQLFVGQQQSDAVVFAAPAGVPDPNAIFNLVNEQRRNAGLPLLVADTSLAKLASDRAADMSTRRYYAHKNPDGQYFYDFLKPSENKSKYACENLDLEFTTNVGTYVNDWLNSTSGHRECMLNKTIRSAGYAAAPFETVDGNGVHTTSYVVVAIHSASLNN